MKEVDPVEPGGRVEADIALLNVNKFPENSPNVICVVSMFRVKSKFE